MNAEDIFINKQSSITLGFNKTIDMELHAKLKAHFQDIVSNEDLFWFLATNSKHFSVIKLNIELP